MDVQKKIVPVAVKVCGVTLAADVDACMRRRLAYVGFNFYTGSKRYIAPPAAASLWTAVLAGQPAVALATTPVGVVVGAGIAEVARLLADFPAVGVVQVHGPKLVTPTYLRQLRQATGDRQLWLAWPVATRQDVLAAAALAADVDLLLFDSKHVPQGAAVPGGSGMVFDWSILKAYPAGLPFGVAGGLQANNLSALAAALAPVRPALIDLCSGVERAPGQKESALIDTVLGVVGEVW